MACWRLSFSLLEQDWRSLPVLLRVPDHRRSHGHRGLPSSWMDPPSRDPTWRGSGMLCLGVWRGASTSSKSFNLTLILARAFEAMSTCSHLGCGGSGVWRSFEI